MNVRASCRRGCNPDWDELRLALPAEGKDLLHEVSLPMGSLGDLLEHPILIGAFLRLCQEDLGIDHDRIEDVVQIMGYAAGEPSHGLQSLGLHDMVFEPFLLALCPFALGYFSFELLIPHIDLGGPLLYEILQTGTVSCQLLFRFFALGDDLREHDDPADLSAVLVPGTHLPAHPVEPSIQPGKGILLTLLDTSGQGALVDLFPPLGDLREHLVMGPARDVLIAQAVVGEPPPAVGDVAHIAVEHCDGCRCVLDKQSQLLIALSQGLIHLLAFGFRFFQSCDSIAGFRQVSHELLLCLVLISHSGSLKEDKTSASHLLTLMTGRPCLGALKNIPS